MTKGIRKITVKMDKDRQINWNLRAVEEFEIGARIYLEEHGYAENGRYVVFTPNKKQPDLPPVRSVDGPFVSAWSALVGFAEIATIHRMALEACLGIEGDELVAALEAYTGSRLELSRQVMEALALAEDPLRAASIRKSWTNFDELQELRRVTQEKVALETVIREFRLRLKLLGGEADLPDLKSVLGPVKLKTSP